MNIVQVHPGILPIPPNGWGAVEKIIWEYQLALKSRGHNCDVLYLNDIDPRKYDIIHVHVANLALMCHEKKIPYYFTCHDHHAYLYGKDSFVFKENYSAIQHSVKSFIPAKYLVDYFNLPNLHYFSHGVNTRYFKYNNQAITGHRLLCVANNGLIHDSSYDRKGFEFAIKTAAELNLPITIAGPSNNRNFFDKFNFKYDKLTVLYNLTETELLNVYQSHTIFLHLSDLEAGHPNLTLLEAMSCGLPVIATYEDNNILPGLKKVTRNVYESVAGVKEIINNYKEWRDKALITAAEKSWDNVVDQLIRHYNINITMREQLMRLYTNTPISIKPTQVSTENKLKINFNNGCKVEILGDINKKYKFTFKNKKTSNVIYETIITNNMWAATSLKYFIDYSITITDLESNATFDYDLDFQNKRVKIINESPSLGDYIAWMPYVDLFQKKHKCIVDFYTPNKHLFEANYKNINFFNYNDQLDVEYHASYQIGCFDPNDKHRSPEDHRTRNLQQVGADILGLDYIEVKPSVVVKDINRKLPGKYVCISTASTAGCKHWQNKTGWQETVNYLNNLHYKVVVIQKEPLNYMDLGGLKNVLHPETKTLDEAITWLYNCEFFIGLGSGISWLAWALNKKVVLISGFSKKFAEFYTPYRVINETVCNGCWNDVNHKFNPGDWNWCPKLKDTPRQFECSKSITFNMVKSNINKIISDKI